MRRRLRDYQLDALKFCRSVKHPALFMEMRLGKTLVAIRRAELIPPQHPEEGLRILIVAPNETLGSWEKELIKENKEYVFLEGVKKKRIALLQSNVPWNLINKEGWLAVPEIGVEDWDCVICDESTFIMNPKAGVTKFFCNGFRDTTCRMILAGKPNPKSKLQLYSQMRFLEGSAFGCSNYWKFRAEFFENKYYVHDWQLKREKKSTFQNYVSDHSFVLRRKDVNLDVPKIFETREVFPNSEVKRIYRTAEDLFILEDAEEVDRSKYAPVQYGWLRQLSSGFLPKEKTLLWDGKIKELLYLIENDLFDEKLVIWFHYRHELAHVKAALEKEGLRVAEIHGDVKKPKRREIERDFETKYDVILCIDETCRFGMDLSPSDTAIYFSPPSGPLTWSQTQDRILKIDDKGLLIIKLVAKGTIEEDIYEALEDEDADARSFMGVVKHNANKRRNKKD